MIYQQITNALVHIIGIGSIIYAGVLVWGIWRMLRKPLPESFSEWSDRKETEFIEKQAALRTKHLTDMGIPKDLHNITSI